MSSIPYRMPGERMPPQAWYVTRWQKRAIKTRRFVQNLRQPSWLGCAFLSGLVLLVATSAWLAQGPVSIVVSVVSTVVGTWVVSPPVRVDDE